MREYDVMESINKMEQNVKDVKSVMSTMLGDMMKDFDIMNNTSYDDESAKCMLMYMKMLSITNKMMDNWFNMQKGICEKLEHIEQTQEEIRENQKREKDFRVFTDIEKNRNKK